MVWAVLAWGILVVLCLGLLLRKQMVEFDSAGRMLGQFPTTGAYLVALKSALPEVNSESRPTLVRVVAKDCPCRFSSLGHWEQMQADYPEVLFQSVSIDELTPAAQALIPATPMALFLTAQHQLVYAGPFSAGALCTSQNSLVEAYVSKQLRQPFVPFDSVGCYCAAS